MAIDIHDETLITFAALAASLPRRRRNRPVHPSTVHRWRSAGIRGVRLEAVRVGGAWATSREAFARFCERLTALETGQDAVAVATSDARRRQQAGEQLAKEGW